MHRGRWLPIGVNGGRRLTRAAKVDTVGLPLKAFVIGSGLLLLIGTIVLVVLVVLGIGGERPGATLTQEAAPSATVANAPVSLPPGARIEQVVPDPAGGPLLLLGTDRNEAQFLAVVDVESGTLVRLIRFRAEAAP